MSVDNDATHPPYISHVHLKGYKSILDTEVVLHSGLNIIIGPNGSGKTNFVEFLRSLVAVDYPETRFKVVLQIVIENIEYIWEINSNKKTILDINRGRKWQHSVDRWIYKKGEDKPTSNDHYLPNLSPYTKYEIIDVFYPISTLSFDMPKDLVGLDKHLSIQVFKENLELDFTNSSSFIKFITRFLLDNFNESFSTDFLLNKESLLEYLKIEEELIRNLKKFSPIENLRVEQGISIKENGLFYYIDHIEFEFLVNGAWLTWNMLSDGTKRLFYLVSEVTLTRGICFIEEPEIGVHPNQYLKILTFLRESAEDKQIIITTHAPRTLDILKDKELDRIILTRYEEGFGTKMRHLSEEEIKYAINYRETEGSTSELWKKIKVSFIPIGKNITGDKLLTPKAVKVINNESIQKNLDFVIIAKDLDALPSNKKQFMALTNKLTKIAKEVNIKLIPFIIIFEQEALILADMEAFNTIYSITHTFKGNPRFQAEPKELLKKITAKSKRTYKESDTPEIFQQLDFKKVYKKHSGTNSFQSFIDDLEKQL